MSGGAICPVSICPACICPVSICPRSVLPRLASCSSGTYCTIYARHWILVVYRAPWQFSSQGFKHKQTCSTHFLHKLDTEPTPLGSTEGRWGRGQSSRLYQFVSTSWTASKRRQRAACKRHTHTQKGGGGFTHTHTHTQKEKKGGRDSHTYTHTVGYTSNDPQKLSPTTTTRKKRRKKREEEQGEENDCGRAVSYTHLRAHET